MKQNNETLFHDIWNIGDRLFGREGLRGGEEDMKTWSNTPLFDSAESSRQAAKGIAVAAENKASLVIHAREIAFNVAKRLGEVDMDDVMYILIAEGERRDCLGNAAGAIFKDRRFEWTGRFRKSCRIQSHGNLLRIWKLADGMK